MEKKRVRRKKMNKIRKRNRIRKKGKIVALFYRLIKLGFVTAH